MLQRIRHFRAQKTTDIRSLLLGQLQLSSDRVDFLLNLGAIYLNEIRVKENCELKANDILRVHLEPKRFPTDNFKIQESIVHLANDFIILNKTAGLPSGPSLDNCQENLLAIAESHLQQKLWLPHRLDVGTRGLICLARNKEFATWMATSLEKRKVLKIYSCETQGIIPQPGVLKHWMRKSNRSPKILSRSPVKSWLACELEILEVKEMAARIARVKIKLDTGRTHQIRAQLSFEGSPIIGDGLYTVGSASSIESFKLICERLSFSFQGKNYDFQLPVTF